ncbi:MAG: hypothetical protein J6Q82_00285 [Clostridia bacterium]|nr:hypothetical protein [Clostridia bacterium]
MGKRCGIERLRSACSRGTARRLLEQYIKRCQESADTQPSDAKRSAKQSRRLPNLAGFCRYLSIGTEDFRHVAEEFPDEIRPLFAILEDEALNSTLPPAVLSAYLKRRLGYEREDEEISAEPLQICFEHDILGDGE